MPSFIPRIRVEVYVPIRYHRAYQDSLTWVIEEFTELRGGCTVNENTGGYYLSRANEVIPDRVSVVYSDFPMDWNNKSDRAEVLDYCAGLKQFLFENLWEEEILIGAYPVSHVDNRPKRSRFTTLNKFLPALNTQLLNRAYHSRRRRREIP